MSKTVLLGLIAFACVALLFCGVGAVGVYLWKQQGPASGAAGSLVVDAGRRGGVGESAKLTADELLAWKKHRQNQTKAIFRIVGYYHAEKRWKSYAGYANGECDEEEANAVCKGLAGEPATKAAVVIDMYGQPSPVAVRWYYDNDAAGVKASNMSPFPELEASLNDFIIAIQSDISKSQLGR